jgi:hypothetical protein
VLPTLKSEKGLLTAMKSTYEVERILKAESLRKEAPLKQAVWGVKLGKEDNVWEPVGWCRCIVGNYLLGQASDKVQTPYGSSPIVDASCLLDISFSAVDDIIKGFDAYPVKVEEPEQRQGEWWQVGYDIAAWANDLGILIRRFPDVEI